MSSTCSLALLALLPGPLAAQEALIDVNTVPPTAVAESSPSDFAVLGGSLYFAADVPGLGRELCVFDGTSVQLVADILPGAASSAPAGMTSSGGYLWFSAVDPVAGRELWRTDGTAVGTEFVADLAAGIKSGSPSSFVEYGAGVLFTASNEVNGFGVWGSDGTAAGTLELMSFSGGGIIGLLDRPEDLTVVGGLGFFRTRFGNGLWRTDGTVAGTYEFTDATWIDVDEIASIGSDLYFSGRTLASSGSIWRTDGATIEVVLEPAPGANLFPRELCGFAGELYYQARGADLTPALFKLDGVTDAPVLLADTDPAGDGRPWKLTPAQTFLAFTVSLDDTTGEEFWRTDGTPAGTFLIQDVVPGDEDLQPTELTAVGDTVVFRGVGPEGAEPWVTDGAQVQLLGDLLAGGSSDPSDFFSDGTTLWFAADDGVVGREVWRTDGTPVGTQLEVDAGPDPSSGGSNPSDLVRVGQRVFFAADDGVHGRELWVSDGTDEGTELLADAFPGPTGSDPYDLTVLGDRLYFFATVVDATSGNDCELWSSDGTPAGTQAISDLVSQGFWAPEDLSAAAGRLWFTADSFAIGREPFSSDGEPGGLEFLGDLNTSTVYKPSEAKGFVAVGEEVVFGARDATNGKFLWRSDGTAAGTQKFEPLPGANEPGQPTSFTALDADRVLFYAAGLGSGFEPWVTDGTAEGTFLLADVQPGPDSSTNFSFFMAAFGDGLAVFLPDSELYGEELWVTDGTVAGTSLLVDLAPGPDDAELDPLGAVGDSFAFRLRTDFVYDLWATDGTAAGTEMLLDVADLPLASGVQQGTTSAGDELYVEVKTALNQFGLWRTDGTPEGTVGVYGVTAPESIDGFTAVGSGRELLLVGSDASGAEVWRTRGTPSTTELLIDIAPGAAGSDPAEFTRVGNQVLFAATLADTGRELFTMPFAPTEGWVAEPYGVACAGTGGLSPRITTDGSAQLGSVVEVGVADAFGPSTAFLFLAFDSSAMPLGDCVQYPADPAFLFGITGTDGTGQGSIATPLPSGVTGLMNVPIYFQWAVIDPAGGFGGAVALTDALELVIGPAL